MSEEHEELLAALGRLQSIVRSSIEPAAPTGSEASLLEAVLKSAQRAGLTPSQTAELMRGLGIVRGAGAEPPAAAPTPDPDPDVHQLLARSVPPEAAPPVDLSTLAVEPSEPPADAPLLPELADPAPAPEAQPAVIDDDPPARSGFRRVSRPAQLKPVRAPLRKVGEKRTAAPARKTPILRVTAERSVPPGAATPPDAERRDRPAPAPERRARPTTNPPAPGSMPPLPRRGQRRSGRRPLRTATSQPPAAAPEASTPPPAAVAPPTVPAPDPLLSRRERPRPAPDVVMPEPAATHSGPDAKAIEEAARALAGSMAGLEDQLRQPTAPSRSAAPARPKRTRPAFDRAASSSTVSSMIDIEIDRAPAFAGNWIWVDADIRSPLRLSLPALLSQQARERGSVHIELTTGRARAIIELRDGRLTSARTNLEGAQLGDILLSQNTLPAAQHPTVRALRTPREAAAWIARTELLDANRLHEAVIAKIRLNLAHCLRWPGGKFRVFSRRQGASTRGRPKLTIASSLLSAIEAIPAQLALSCLERFRNFTLDPGEHHREAKVYKKDEACSLLLTRRPHPEPLGELIARARMSRLDTMRRVVLLLEVGAITFGNEQRRTGAQEVRREAKTPVPGFDCTPLAQQFDLDPAAAESLVMDTLRACLVHVASVDEPSINDLISLARLAISRDARPAATTEADRALIERFKAAGLTMPEVSDFYDLLIEMLAAQGVDLHRLVPKQSVIGVLLYTNR